jgi:hypothetical protein
LIITGPAGRGDNRHKIILDGFANNDLMHLRTRGENGLCRNFAIGWQRDTGFLASDQPEDFCFILVRRIANENVQEEPVHLCLREWVSSLLFDGILCGPG